MNPAVERRAGDHRNGGRRATDRTRAPGGIRCFTLRRAQDTSGVSGTGVVLEGVLFTTGVVVIHWLTPGPRGSIAIFDSLEQFLSIHVHPHPENGAVLTFDDEVGLKGGLLSL